MTTTTDILRRLERIDEALGLSGFRGYASDPCFHVQIEGSGRFVRVTDGATAWFTDADAFDAGLDAVVEHAEKAAAEGRAERAAEDHYSLVFCQLIPGDLLGDEPLACTAAWAVEDNEGDEWLAQADDLDDLVQRLDALREAANLADRVTGDVCDLTSLPTFGGDEPDDTEGIYSWDEERLLIDSVAGWEIMPRPRLNHFALVANCGQDQGKAEAVWTDYRDAGHPAVIADALARVEAAGGFSVVTWVYVDGPCEAGDLLDLTGDDGCASVVE